MTSPQQGLKRVLDLVGSLVGLTLFFPLMLFSAAATYLTIGRPVLFRQQRPGLLGRPFILLKYRTMTEEHDSAERLLPDEDRLTRSGSLMRKFSLDELPQLWNVLRGDMSLVGPRPLLMEYLPRYTVIQRRRHEVKPGITGWAQIHGRNALTWEEKFTLDVWYVDNWSIGLDMKIIARTIWFTLRGVGISRPGYATMPEFVGTSSHSDFVGS